MKLRYMIDSVLVDLHGETPTYVPVGVWVQGPGPGLDVEMYYLDMGPNALADRKEEADWVLNRLVESGATSLPDDFLEYHRASRSIYDGHFSQVTETEAYEAHPSLATDVLRHL